MRLTRLAKDLVGLLRWWPVRLISLMRDNQVALIRLSKRSTFASAAGGADHGSKGPFRMLWLQLSEGNRVVCWARPQQQQQQPVEVPESSEQAGTARHGLEASVHVGMASEADVEGQPLRLPPGGEASVNSVSDAARCEKQA